MSKQVIKVKMDDIWSNKHGKEPQNNSPILNYCRKLLELGHPKNTRLEVYRENDKPDVICANIGKAAKWAIKENIKEGPKFREYLPFPSSLKAPRAFHLASADALKKKIGDTLPGRDKTNG